MSFVKARGGGFGMDAELASKLSLKFNVGRAAAAIKWLVTLTGARTIASNHQAVRSRIETDFTFDFRFGCICRRRNGRQAQRRPLALRCCQPSAGETSQPHSCFVCDCVTPLAAQRLSQGERQSHAVQADGERAMHRRRFAST